MFGRFNFIKRRSHPKTFHVLALDGAMHTYELEVSGCMCARVSVLYQRTLIIRTASHCKLWFV